MRVLAVIGDIVVSKDIARRKAFQRKLASVLIGRSKEKGSSLISPYTITLGDEFQAVYRSASSLWPDLITLLAEIHPVQARFGLGVGELATKLNSKQALGMDGPAFHRARTAVVALKNSGARFQIAGESDAMWALPNHALAYMSHHLVGWEKNRLQILAALLRKRTVSEFERELPISKVAIYKNINSAALNEVAAILAETARTIDAALDVT